MAQVTDKQLDEMLDGLTVGGIYRLAWTLVKAWLGMVLGVAAFGIVVSLLLGGALGIIFLIFEHAR